MKNIKGQTMFCCEDCQMYELCNYYHNRRGKSNICENFTLFPNNATNGDVIKAMFPKVKTTGHYIKTENDSIRNHAIGDEILRCSDSWWNTPYKVESENKGNECKFNHRL